MGSLFYGNSIEPTPIPDAILAHLKVVAGTKLRRNEAFTLSWRHVDDAAPGRTTLWLQPSIPLRFVFESDEPEALNPSVLKDMANQANSSAGLTIDLAADLTASTAATPARAVRAA
jgi:hypothetical protein